MQKVNIRKLAGLLNAYQNCVKSNNQEWKIKHHSAILDLLGDNLPSGSGIDNGSYFLWDESNPEKLMFKCDFHHMNENGYYDGWTEHNITVTPSLYFGFNIKISGKNRNQIKDYLTELFQETFTIE